MAKERFYPAEENLGKNCAYWRLSTDRTNTTLSRIAIGCTYPKGEMEGRLSCEGLIDNVCLYIKDKKRLPSLTDKKIIQISLVMAEGNNRDLPPGDTH